MPRASFVRNVGILGGGTALAQALSVLVLPIITRLYTPEDFSVLAVYSALLSMIAVVACLRFEIAIPLPKDDLEAANLMVLGLFFSTFISVNVALLVWLFPGHIAKGLGQPALQPYLWLLPAGVWLSGIYACAQYWATRTKRFTAIAQTRLTRSLGSVITQIAMGWVTQTAPLGLLLGQLAGAGTGFLKLGKVALVDIQPLKKSINRFTLQSAFKKYSRLPKYSTLESLANMASLQMPLVIIAAAKLGSEAGFTLLAMKAAAIPMSLIGNSISQVYLSRAADAVLAGTLAELTLKIIIGLVGWGVGPLLCIGMLSPDLMPLVFGPKWTRAGEIMTWMIPWFIFQFLSSPISMALHVTAQQSLAMVNQVWGMVLRVGLTSLATLYMGEYIVEIYCLTGILFYFGYFIIILRVSGVQLLSLLRSLKHQFLIVSWWVVLAIILKLWIGRFSLALVP